MALPHLNDPAIQAYRHQWLEAAFAPGTIEAVVTFGTPAFNAWTAFKATPAGQAVTAVHHRKRCTRRRTSPAARSPARICSTTGTSRCRALHASIQHPDVIKPLVPYGADFTPGGLPEIPSRDLTDGTAVLDARHRLLGIDVSHARHGAREHLHRSPLGQEPVSPRPSIPTTIQPQFWVDRAATAIRFYQAAFGVTVLLQVGEGEDLVAQLAVGDAVFWVAATDAQPPRFTPAAVGGATGRTLLVVDDPDAVFAQAVAAGARRACPRWPTSTAGGSVASSTRSATSGKLGRPLSG